LPSKIHSCVWKRGATRVFKFFIFLLKINFFYILDCFDTLISKIILKNIILMHFGMENALKNNHNHTPKQ